MTVKFNDSNDFGLVVFVPCCSVVTRTIRFLEADFCVMRLPSKERFAYRNTNLPRNENPICRNGIGSRQNFKLVSEQDNIYNFTTLQHEDLVVC